MSKYGTCFPYILGINDCSAIGDVSILFHNQYTDSGNLIINIFFRNIFGNVQYVYTVFSGTATPHNDSAVESY